MTTGPVNFTLDAVGNYCFISTFQDHCPSGQRLAIHVIYAPVPAPFPYRYPRTRAPVVGDDLGWLVPLGGTLPHAVWALRKDFYVGDTLIFNFVNGSSDVAMVTKDAIFNCTNTTISVYSTSPAKIPLTTPGDHFYTSTYPRQQLAIYVYGYASNAPSPSPSSHSPHPSGSPTPSAHGFSSGLSKAPARVSGLSRVAVTTLSIAIALFH
ncbi:LOW QUALITY PROTEIN: Phytocyanin domain [Dillenia turbinata]|uniref:Phytocyanin domain n=1 Tax=Dillenia turbinata TaxID=194707 RepID=A0AAN8WFP6_9MAGN